MNTASPKPDTFFAGRLINVSLEDGVTMNVKVRQLRLADYERALPLLKDEIALTAFCCVLADAAASPAGTAPFTKEWVNTLQPESYEELQAAAQEVNAKGFFSYAARHVERDRRAKEEIVRSMASMPAETLRAVTEMANSNSTPLSPKPRPIVR